MYMGHLSPSMWGQTLNESINLSLQMVMTKLITYYLLACVLIFSTPNLLIITLVSEQLEQEQMHRNGDHMEG